MVEEIAGVGDPSEGVAVRHLGGGHASFLLVGFVQREGVKGER